MGLDPSQILGDDGEGSRTIGIDVIDPDARGTAGDGGVGGGDLFGPSGGGRSRPARAAAGETPVRLRARGFIGDVAWEIPFEVFQVVDPWLAAERPGREEASALEPVGRVHAYLKDVVLRDLMAENERLPDEREYDFVASGLADLPRLTAEWVEKRARDRMAAKVQAMRERGAALGIEEDTLERLLGEVMA